MALSYYLFLFSAACGFAVVSAKCGDTMFECRNGMCVDRRKQCNGQADCQDWSDETMTSCRGIYRPFWNLVFVCGNEQVRNTLDDVCPVSCASNAIDCGLHLAALTVQTPIAKPPPTASCKYPRVVVNGRISVNGEIDVVNSTASHGSDLRFSCNEWYDLIGKSKVYCQFGSWSDPFPTCVLWRPSSGMRRGGGGEVLQTSAGTAGVAGNNIARRISPPPPPLIPKNGCAQGSTRDRCILPPHPEHGRYTVPSKNDSRPGDHFEAVYLNYECNTGYEIVGHNIVTCYRGTWGTVSYPTCTQLCKLNPHPSIIHKCHVSNNFGGFRPCNLYERQGTLVTPECNSPDYYHTGILKIMTCIDGNWDHVPTCEPECGRVTPAGYPTQIGGRPAEQGEFPWHAGIYKKTVSPYQQICGGSLVSTTMVISAAHCFWKDDQKQALPATNFAVGLGKIYRPYLNPRDEGRQLFNVRDLKVATGYRGIETLFQYDLALVFLDRSAQYRHHVRPVCIDFDIIFDRRQLATGKRGKIAGWGYTEENSKASAPILQVLELPVVSTDECMSRVQSSFQQYITSDKFCAGYWNAGKALCKGDSGGGLVFAVADHLTERYYLRGVASSVDKNGTAGCNSGAVATFTRVSSQEIFIKEYLRI